MRYGHLMPFGAHCAGEEGTRFRLWAPDARRVVLQADSAEGARLQADLDEVEQGWYELLVAGLGAGARYCYRIDDEVEVPDPASRFNPDGVLARSEVLDPHAFDWHEESVSTLAASASRLAPQAASPWRGRDWNEAVICELHVGTFTPQGTYGAIVARLDQLADVGVTALELMPVGAFPGRRGWGYDSVLPFAPHAAYGRPEDLKRLVQAAHERQLMVLLDVVYNHFGPEGNYLPRYASGMFTDRHCTPWGNAIDFSRAAVREFFIHNALYWIEEYRFDGLRIDAVHEMHDESSTHFIDELVDTVASGPGRERRVHVVLENGRNEARRLRLRPLPALPRFTGEGAEPRSPRAAQAGSEQPSPPERGTRPSQVEQGVHLSQMDQSAQPSQAEYGAPPSQVERGARFSQVHQSAQPSQVEQGARCSRAERDAAAFSSPPPLAGEGREGASAAQWNDDFHHALHVILTGERDGYYIDYADQPIERLGRALAQGFAYQGERSAFSGEARGEPSGDLPPSAFVSFLQNHDQIGNRACGERLSKLAEPGPLRAALAILLLSPQIPMLFMGEDYGAAQPFLYFCDYTGELAAAVREGRRAEFAAFAAFAAAEKREQIPDPNAWQTFERSRLVWADRNRTPHARWQSNVRELLQVRSRSVVPLIAQIVPGQSTYDVRGRTLTVKWPARDGRALTLQANLDRVAADGGVEGELLFSTCPRPEDRSALAAWEVRLLLQRPR